jgi:hypothetical protein
MRDRLNYLAAVQARLPFTDQTLIAEVLDELDDHIADSTQALAATGVDPTEAESRALARLGQPETLADEIAKAHQTNARLLAAVGGAIWPATKTAVKTYLVAAALTIGAALPIAVLAQVLGDAGLNDWLSDASRSVTTAVALVIVAYVVGGRVTDLIAARSRRSLAWSRRYCALGGFVMLAAIVTFWFRGPQSLSSVVVFELVPFAWAFGCHHGTYRPSAPTKFLSVALAAVSIGLLIVLMIPTTSVVVVSATGPVPVTSSPGPIIGPAGPEPEGASLAQVQIDFPSSLKAAGTKRYFLSRASVPPGFANLRFEAWPASRTDRLEIDPKATVPFDVRPAEAATDGSGPSVAATIDLRAHRSLGQIAIVLTGVSAGQRYLLSSPALDDYHFEGSVWDWLTAH